MKKCGLIAFLILLIPLLSFSSGVREEESFTYAGITRIEIRGVFLNVEVRGENNGSVQMRSDLPQGAFFLARDFEVKHEVIGSELRVWVERDGVFSRGSGTLFFRVPEGTDLSVETASGDVRISGITAPELRANSASGDITMSDIQGKVTVGTISGNLSARKLKGDLDLTTISGDMDLSGASGRLSVKSISGAIRGENLLLEKSSDFKTVSGDILLDLENALDELRYELSTVSGRLKVGSVSATRGLEMGTSALVLKGESVSGSQTYR